MATQAPIKHKIVQSLSNLPDDTLTEVLRFVEFLQFKAGGSSARRPIRLHGIWSGVSPDGLEMEIRRLRREVTEQLDRECEELIGGDVSR